MKKFLLSVFITFNLFCLPQALLADSGGGAQHSTWEVMGYIHTQTTLVPTTDTSQLLTAAFDTAYAGDPLTWTGVKAALITVETNSARVSWGVAAENDGTPVGHLKAPGESVYIEGYNAISRTYIISATAGSAASLQVTLLY